MAHQPSCHLQFSYPSSCLSRWICCNIIREDDLETAQFASAEAQSEMAHMTEKMEAMHGEKEAAVEAARRAVAALDAAKGEAAKASGSAERHQQVWSLRYGV